MSQDLILYGYWRSTAAYRVRIALNLKQLPYEYRAVHLVRDGGEQHAAAYRELNPQELVPVLVHGHSAIRQSLAIMEYLDECWPALEPLLPSMASDRAYARAIAQLVACDVHPLGNLRVLQYLERECSLSKAQRDVWSRHWITVGFDALERLLREHPGTGPYCLGDAPSLADACLVPQVYNARRWGLDMDKWPTIQAIDDACRPLSAFQAAAPEVQPDAPDAA